MAALRLPPCPEQHQLRQGRPARAGLGRHGYTPRSRSSPLLCLAERRFPPTRAFHHRDLHKCPNPSREVPVSRPRHSFRGEQNCAWAAGAAPPPAGHPAGAPAALRAPADPAQRAAGGRWPFPACLTARRRTPSRLLAHCRWGSARRGSGVPAGPPPAARSLRPLPPAAAGERSQLPLTTLDLPSPLLRAARAPLPPPASPGADSPQSRKQLQRAHRRAPAMAAPGAALPQQRRCRRRRRAMTPGAVLAGG